MKRNYIYVLILISLLTGVYIIYSRGLYPFGNYDSNISEGVNVGQRAPDFTLEKINGKEITLSEMRRKKVFLNF
ncbi:MAG: hypothetical protein ACOCQN_00125 [Halanaerobiaceae bacterium]